MSVDQIHALEQEFLGPANQSAIANEVESRVREAMLWDKRRRQTFDRVLIHRFSRLFHNTTDIGREAEQEGVTRAIIPGFTAAMTKMMGLEIHEQCQIKANAVVARAFDIDTGLIDWEAVYRDPKLRYLVDSVLIIIAHHFQNYERRCEWLMEVIDNHIPKDDKQKRLDNCAHVSKRGVCMVMSDLFDDICTEAERDPTAFAKTFGAEALERIRHIKRLIGETAEKLTPRDCD